MKFDCLQENLSKTLSIVSRFTPARPQLPILANVLISAKKGELLLGATNLESGINFHLGAKIDEEGEIALPAKTLTELVGSFPAGKIEFLQEENNVKIICQRNQTILAGISAVEFPPLPKIGKEEVLKFLGSEISGPISQTAYCSATDESRPVLGAVKILEKSGFLFFVATDGYRLSLKTTQIKAPKNLANGILLPARILTEVVKILAESEKKEVGLEISGENNQAIFSLGEVEIFCRMIEGQYPDFEKIIPQSFTTRAIFQKEEFLLAVKTTSIFAREAANIIKFKIQNEKFEISANAPQVGENTTEIEAKIEGEGGQIAFNCRFLLDFLNNVSASEIVFEMTTSTAPGVFKIQGDDSLLHLIMPVRVQE